MSGTEIAAAAEVANSPCIIFAYHEMGHACLSALLEMGAPVAALFSHDDNPDERIWWRSCADLARRNRVPVFTPAKLDSNWLARIAGLGCAIIYSFSYRHLLDADVLKMAPLGAYNLHPSLLPAYRGRAPVNWVLVNGEPETGVTLHHMVARADAGDIVAQRSVAISDSDDALALYRKLVPIGAGLIREFHPLIVERRAPRIPQDLARGSYCGRRRPQDGAIDWRWSARRIFNLVRAVTHPYPGAFSAIAGKKLFVWRAAVFHEDGCRGAPGAVIAVHRGRGPEVAAGSGSLLLQSVQLEGEVEEPASDLLAGLRIAGELKLG